MICAIMQPTYLPWSGYFNLIAASDVFVLLDDVQFEKQSWQSRNRILLNGQPHVLSVPVRRTGLDTLIGAAEINYGQDWVKTQLRTIEQAYARATHGKAMLELLAPLLEARPPLLAELTISVIEAVAQRLELPARRLRASTLGCDGKRSEHVARICHSVGATHYLSPRGSQEYMEQDDFAGNSGLPVTFQEYRPGAYPQKGSREFVSHLSVIDVAAQIGWDLAAEYVRQSDWAPKENHS